jgi:5-methyltetrahydrofolate--homocysteine methyltransferase
MGRFLGRKAIDADELRPEDFLADYDRIVASWGHVKDDVLRGLSPLPFFPWLEAMLGARVQIGDEAVWTAEGGFAYETLDGLDLTDGNPWRSKYLEFVTVLKGRYGMRCPVGQPILRGVSDMIASLRGAEQMVFDLYDRPEQFQRLAKACSALLIRLIEAQQGITGAFAGGYAIEQLALWAPDRIIRMQEDGSAFLSPLLYRQYLLSEDMRQASSFPYSVIHLHSSSLFLLEQILEIGSLKCIQINKDVGEAGIREMLPFLKKVQEHGKPLLIRGKIDHEEAGLLRRELTPKGLYLQIVVEGPEEIDQWNYLFQPWEQGML